MSESDDTDVLLLIPPNLFVLPSDSELDSPSETPSVVEGLINHVNNIDSRLHRIENQTSFCSNSLPDSENSRLMVNKEFEIGKNANSTGQCTDTPLNRELILDDIDSYLEAKRNLNKMDQRNYTVPNAAAGNSSKRLGLSDVDKLLKEMELTQSEIENKLRNREVEYGLRDREDNLAQRKGFSCGDNLGSVPDLGYGVREMFSSSPYTSPVKNGSPSKQPPVAVEEPFVKRDAYLVGSSSHSDEFRRSSSASLTSRSPQKDFQRSSGNRSRNFVSPRRRLNLTELPQKIQTEDRLDVDLLAKGDFKLDSNGFRRPLTRPNLISLTDLWKGEDSNEDPTKLRQKLEEEKFRRIHLENTIQGLNRRVLEEQEKLAVAMKVDEGKDKAISSITEAWRQMVEHWKEIEAERHSVSTKIIEERAIIKKAQDEVNRKIERWEKEVSQALDLAAGYKSKCEFLESELSVFKEVSESRVKELEESLCAKQKALDDLLQERNLLTEKLQISEEEHEEDELYQVLEKRLSQIKGMEKRLVEIARKEVQVVQGNLNKVEAELTVVKEQKELLGTRLKEEKGRNSILDTQKMNLEEALSESRIRQAKAEEEARKAVAHLETSRSELRALYQSQLEAVVQDKLAEFQGQLDAAQSAMQLEVESSRKTALERAEQQQQSLVNSHVIEMRRLEAMHKEELRVLEKKYMESERRRLKLENGKKDIAQKLHGVMETQWQQALNIITSELSMRQSEPSQEKKRDPKLPSKIQDESESSDETPFNKDGQLTCRSSCPKPNISGKQDQLLRYIQMLLEKTPGKPAESWQDSTTQSEQLDESLNDGGWSQDMLKPPPPTNLNAGLSNAKKPPWK